MSSSPEFPPALRSEISARLLQTVDDPNVRKAFGSTEMLEIDGAELEKLCQAIWIIGYAEALGDIADGPGPWPKLPSFAQEIMQHMPERR